MRAQPVSSDELVKPKEQELEKKRSVLARLMADQEIRKQKLSKLLIIDDDVDLTQAFKYLFLSSFGHIDIDVAHDACEAMSQIVQKSYDLIVLDWNLPNLTGPEIIDQVDKYFYDHPHNRYSVRDRKIPVLILSGYASIHMDLHPHHYFNYIGRVSKRQRLGEIMTQIKSSINEGL